MFIIKIYVSKQMYDSPQYILKYNFINLKDKMNEL